MGGFFGTERVSFDLFGPVHLATIGALAVVGICLIRAGLVADERGRRHLRLALGLTILLLLLARHIWKAASGLWTVEHDIPLHLCSAMALVTIYGLWTREPRVLRLMYFLGVAGAVQAVLTPDSEFGAVHFTFFESLGSHGAVVIAGVWAVMVEGYRPTSRDPWIVFGLLNLYAAVVYPINRLLGSNYLYLIDKPPGPTILDFFPGWPWYILLIEPVAIGLFLALRLPFRNPAAG
ncbi:MAG: TIGR02206 family membrane protein [Gemmatimonadales bacterium]|nr:TIGR02206 family membrane protein [Candidatus Palauibacter irciniicola]MYC18679.1 TIGR02206 family membrane protein [Gemmatimonadales bacterium]